MSHTFYAPKTLLNVATGGLWSNIIGDQQKAPKVPTVDKAAVDEKAKSEEEARKLRAREKMREGVSSTLVSGTGNTAFSQMQSNKKSLLG